MVRQVAQQTPRAGTVATTVTAARSTRPSPTLALDGLRGYFQSQRAGLDGRLVARLTAFMDGTKDSLDCAIYDLRHPDILAALAHLAARGVRVRIAFDGGAERTGGVSADPKPTGTRHALADADLLSLATPVHARGRHLMHLKVAIRDAQAVWVGSANFTRGGLELQDNTCLEIASAELAATFSAAFEDLLRPTHRHALAAHSAAAAAAQPAVRVGGAILRPLFAPAAGEGIEDTIVAALRSARKVRVLAFLLSDPGILAAFAPLAADPNMDIRGVYDPHGMQDVLRYTRQDHAHFWFLHDPRFVAAPSHAFSPGHEQDFMHNKTLIIDDRLVFTGSYNFSENAEANDEVVLAIDSAAVAAAYTDYFEALTRAYGAHGAARATDRPDGEPTPPSARRTSAQGADAHPSVVHQASLGHREASAPAAASRAAASRAAASRPAEERIYAARDKGRRRMALDAILVVVALLALAVAITLVVVLISAGILHPNLHP